jgi:hypothetical protein
VVVGQDAEGLHQEALLLYLHPEEHYSTQRDQ